MAKRRVRAAPDIATPEEVLRTFTQIMRGEMTESGGRKGPSGEEVCLPPKVSERSRAAELLGKRYGLFSERDAGEPSAEVAGLIEAAMQSIAQEHEQGGAWATGMPPGAGGPLVRPDAADGRPAWRMDA